MYLFLTPSKTDGRVPTQQPDLLGRFRPVGCGQRTKFSPSVGRGEGGGRKMEKWVWPKGNIYPFNWGEMGGRGKRFRANNT